MFSNGSLFSNTTFIGITWRVVIIPNYVVPKTDSARHVQGSQRSMQNWIWAPTSCQSRGILRRKLVNRSDFKVTPVFIKFGSPASGSGDFVGHDVIDVCRTTTPHRRCEVEWWQSPQGYPYVIIHCIHFSSRGVGPGCSVNRKMGFGQIDVRFRDHCQVTRLTLSK
jgi:hypothetical protein